MNKLFEKGIAILSAFSALAAPVIATAAAGESPLNQQLYSLTWENENLKAENKELENRLKMYEDRMAKMSATAESVMAMGDNINRCDINGDGLIDAADASIILSAYSLFSTGEDIKYISQVINWEGNYD